MDRFLSELLIAIIAFASTNIDDLLTNHHLFRDRLKRYSGIVVPWILIALGMKVLLQASPLLK
jgi:cadmium resistance protein CadD (predicted permease)